MLGVFYIAHDNREMLTITFSHLSNMIKTTFRIYQSAQTGQF